MEAVLNNLSASEKFVLIRSDDGTEFTTNLEKFVNKKSILLKDVESASNESADVLVCCQIPDESYNYELLTRLMKVLKPGGRLILSNISNKEKIKLDLIIKGFMNVNVLDGIIMTNKPSFKQGSSAQLKLPVKIPTSIWKLDAASDEVGTIDPDDLLDEDDLAKPDPQSLRVCGTTGKRKACKDCSCGLAEELANGAGNDKIIDTANAPKSSCGSCYLGDAFRCASCPYLGMPAFKPGEKIQLLGNQLEADL